jgi:hypothetical protein
VIGVIEKTRILAPLNKRGFFMFDFSNIDEAIKNFRKDKLGIYISEMQGQIGIFFNIGQSNGKKKI